jgi:hypothetical protein
MAEHSDIGEYNQKMPKVYTQADLGKNGYPNKVANTQTQKTRGTGAATRGTGHSKKMG